MDIKPINDDQNHMTPSVEPGSRSVSRSVRIDNVQNQNRVSAKGQEGETQSYRVDESSRRIVISLVDTESGEVIERLSPAEAVAYVRHLNEAIKNMLNELA